MILKLSHYPSAEPKVFALDVLMKVQILHPAAPSNHPAQPVLLRTRVYTPPTSHFLFNLTCPYFYEYPTNSNCVSVSRGTFQPRRFSRQSI
jgi:hypothetical protein